MNETTRTFTQRRYVRVPCNAAATITRGDRTTAGVCDSLSVGGAFFRGEAAPARAPVRWSCACLPWADRGAGRGLYSRGEGIGIRFTQLPPAR
jgi:hypothetical protein